jgi:curved DNA-binding protein CbpA
VDTRERTRILDWDAQIDRLSYEQILGIPEDAALGDCQRAYYQFAQCFHPDMHPGADREAHAALCRVFQRGSEAYRVLTHPSLRARWTRLKREGALRLGDLAPTPTVDLQDELPNLHIRCRSGGAKLEARQAAIAFSSGDVARALAHLEKAMQFEGGASLDLARCLEAIRERETGY